MRRVSCRSTARTRIPTTPNDDWKHFCFPQAEVRGMNFAPSTTRQPVTLVTKKAKMPTASLRSKRHDVEESDNVHARSDTHCPIQLNVLPSFREERLLKTSGLMANEIG